MILSLHLCIFSRQLLTSHFIEFHDYFLLSLSFSVILLNHLTSYLCMILRPTPTPLSLTELFHACFGCRLPFCSLFLRLYCMALSPLFPPFFLFLFCFLPCSTFLCPCPFSLPPHLPSPQSYCCFDSSAQFLLLSLLSQLQ